MRHQSVVATHHRPSVTSTNINVLQLKHTCRFRKTGSVLLFSKWMRQRLDRFRGIYFDRCPAPLSRQVIDCRSFNPRQWASSDKAVQGDNSALQISKWQNEPLERPQPPFLAPNYLACATNNYSRRFAASVCVSRVFLLPLDLRKTSAQESSLPTNAE